MAVLIASAALALVPPSAAHEDTNHGTIKVHDELIVSPPTRNQPHVCGDFWIEGFAMAGATGTLSIFSAPPTGDGTEVLNATWAGEAQADGKFHFLAGPFNLTAIGHFRVEVYLDQGHPGANVEHFAKVKMFWVDCLPIAIPCPPGLEVVANANGSIELTFDAAASVDLGVAADIAAEVQATVDAAAEAAAAAAMQVEGEAEADAEGEVEVTADVEALVATGMNIYRAEGEGDFELIATVGADVTSFVDLNTTVGASYTYMVTILVGNFESINCEVVEVTPIPDFPTPLAIGLASAGGALAYLGLRRRKA